jgi:transposase
MVAFAQANTISEAARCFQTTRKTVRTWLQRKEAGEPLTDRSRRPHTSPNKTPQETADAVAEARQDTGYGPHRLSDWLLRTEGIEISPWTIRNILDRRDLIDKTKNRSTCYPAHWAWEQDGEDPFSLAGGRCQRRPR